MTLTPKQTEILRAALALRGGVPTANAYRARVALGDAIALMNSGFVVRCVDLLGGVFYKVTGAGVRAVCPGARAAVYVPTGDAVTVFTSALGKYRMRWDGVDRGRFQQGVVYRASAKALRFSSDGNG